jgi:hypothetical protein
MGERLEGVGAVGCRVVHCSDPASGEADIKQSLPQRQEG